MQVELCRHVKPNGLQCQAVALNSSVFCYFHRRLHDSHRLYRDTIVGRPDLARRGAIFDLGTLEDRVAIQIAISKVVNALATNPLDLKHGRTLLYGLQLASANARNLDPIPEPHAVVREVHPSPGLLDETATDIAAPGRTTDLPEPFESPTAPEPIPAQPASEPAPTLVLCAAAADPARIPHHTACRTPRNEQAQGHTRHRVAVQFSSAGESNGRASNGCAGTVAEASRVGTSDGIGRLAAADSRRNRVGEV